MRYAAAAALAVAEDAEDVANERAREQRRLISTKAFFVITSIFLGGGRAGATSERERGEHCIVG